ncbi:MAG TPA: amidohydrolase family protein [Longimicrobiales bacterium]|nr:amidohydrolase family protein [Longimicrobiales bacterium]
MPDAGAALRLEGALVVTCDDAGLAGPLSVAVVGDRVAAVGEPDEVRARHPDAEVVPCDGRLLLPGLVNAHLHPELHVLKGMLEELDLHGWSEVEHFEGALAVLSAPEGSWLQRAAIRAAFADCLLTGTTTVQIYGVTRGADIVAAEEAAAFGLRGEITLRDRTFAPAPPDTPPHRYRLHAEEALTREELVVAAAAHARGEALVMHAAETEHRLAVAIQTFGTTTIRLLDRHGLLSPRMLLSHAVHTDDEERDLIARRGAPVVSSPSAELKLSDGVAPITDYLARGCTVALGTDAAVCNNSNDMFLEMRQLGLVQKLRYGAEAIPAEQILRIATRGGARALGREAGTGALVEGGPADLVLVDLHNLRLQPLVHRADFSNLAANLVYAATGQDVTDVMVAGIWRVRDRHLLSAQLDGVVADLGRAAAFLYDRIR